MLNQRRESDWVILVGGSCNERSRRLDEERESGFLCLLRLILMIDDSPWLLLGSEEEYSLLGLRNEMDRFASRCIKSFIT